MFTGGHESCCAKSTMLADPKVEEHLPYTSPTASPPPFLPLVARSPLTPFTNSTISKLSGLFRVQLENLFMHPLNFALRQNIHFLLLQNTSNWEYMLYVPVN